MPDFPHATANFIPDSPASDNRGRHPATASGDAAAIAVTGLTKRVADASGELTILHSVDFTVQKAETLAIVGASGSGKSTLLGLLAGLDTPSDGKVLIDGTDIFALDEDGRASLRKAKLGFVFQSFQLLPHLTAVENVMLPLELAGDGDARPKAEAMLGRVGLSSRLKHYPKYLSGGEQQRVALARAFVTQPPLLLADEPTGSLDAATGEAVIALMFELNREHGSTLVLVTHDPAMAARCGRTITIAAGRLV
ncbi:ABC transporter ATP-binding protein [Pseudoduganella umbonata]|uniref:ABC transporter ATP-binding protein n=1 Tax=Pseudoduganella umbonata TaxID=864828 RepID=A0A4P8HNS1_9BURK|nr:ABC transporter ATP-binding protein [Pseudoduganella umbonata]MBB3220107.1 putative ABC transport system ATP-binding protein [Pseudoduganella umbonata]QCP10102.1 ABC transporter ATP-binding protein [Pseudoduganella umbonata]